MGAGADAMSRRIVIATPHERFDLLEAHLSADPRFTVWRIRDRAGLTVEVLEAIAPDYVFFPQWSWKIPAAIHRSFRCVIFHMTDVPFGRGGSPLQNLIVRGFRETRLTALECVEEMDAGPVYLKRALSLLGTGEEIFLRAGELMAEMIREIALSDPAPQPQQGEVVEFQRRTPADSSLDGVDTLEAVFDRVRMLDAAGYPAAFLDAGPFRLEFSRASLKPDCVLADVRIKLREAEK